MCARLLADECWCWLGWGWGLGSSFNDFKSGEGLEKFRGEGWIALDIESLSVPGGALNFRSRRFGRACRPA